MSVVLGWCIRVVGQGTMGKAYKKVVKFLNDNNVDESKALKTLNIYAKKKQTSHMVRVASWSAICYDTLQYLKLLEKAIEDLTKFWVIEESSEETAWKKTDIWSESTKSGKAAGIVDKKFKKSLKSLGISNTNDCSWT